MSNKETKSSCKEDIHRSINTPIYASAAFEFSSAEEMEEAFQGRTQQHTYSRISNPTVESFEEKVREYSNAVAVTALSSGMAAIANTFMCIAYSGSNIVTSPHLFGNTYSLLQYTLADFGVEVRFCNMLNPSEVEKNVDGNTCAIFAEVVTNPQMEVVDLRMLSDIAQRAKVPLIVDTTVIPWSVFHAKEFGVDIEVVSSTKYISGGATSIGGLIVDHATFDWFNSKKLKSFATDFGKMAFHKKLRTEVFRNLGSCMSPQTAYMQSIGLESLDLRYGQMSGTALELARFLEFQPKVKKVNYVGLENNPFYGISRLQFGETSGAMLTFTLESKEACYAFINKLNLIKRATNLFDNKTLIIHPLSTIYGTFPEEVKSKINVPDNMLRLSVGLERLESLKADILQALT